MINKQSALSFESSKYLETDEEIIWSGKPIKAPFILKGLSVSAFGLVWLSFTMFAMWLMVFPPIGVIVEDSGLGTFVLLVFVLIGFGLTLGPPIPTILRYRKTKYMITSKRLITQTGVIGLDTRFVDFDKIQEVHVRVGLGDKIFGTGSLIIVTAGFIFMGVTGPYCCF
ncbi:MAG: PH domain-containing protein, partial [Candidatus Bathyarchaeota archaeon]|nr:PH domain-containing protein [Candidatus Bathyarchaeota archaeon]